MSDSLKYVSLEFDDYELYKLVQRDFKLFFKNHDFQSLNMCMKNIFNCLEDSIFKKYFVKENKNYSVLINLCGVADSLINKSDLKVDYILDVYQEDMDSIYFDGNYHIIRMLDELQNSDSAIYFIVTSEDNFNVATMFEEQLRVKKCVSFIFVDSKNNNDVKMIINKFSDVLRRQSFNLENVNCFKKRINNNNVITCDYIKVSQKNMETIIITLSVCENIVFDIFYKEHNFILI
ncbi:hypothetical protein [Haploplasma axanthum]|nr:hypothetical protein [Haploplasma axanthum]